MWRAGGVLQLFWVLWIFPCSDSRVPIRPLQPRLETWFYVELSIVIGGTLRKTGKERPYFFPSRRAIDHRYFFDRTNLLGCVHNDE